MAFCSICCVKSIQCLRVYVAPPWQRLFGFISVYCIGFLWLYWVQLIFVKIPISVINMICIGTYISTYLANTTAIKINGHYLRMQSYIKMELMPTGPP